MCEVFGGPHPPAKLMAPKSEGGYGLGDVAMRVRRRCVEDPLYLGAEVLSYRRLPLLRNPAWFHVAAAKSFVAQKNTMLLAPRGHLKTTVMDEIGTIWQWLRYPDDRILFVQATLDNGKKLARQVREHLTSNVPFRELFPEYAMSGMSDEGAVTSFRIPCRTAPWREGSLDVAAPGVSLSGNHYDVTAASDVMNEHSSPPPCGDGSMEEMLKIIAWYATLDGLLESHAVNPRAHKRYDGTFWHDSDLSKEIIRLDTKDTINKIVCGIKRDDAGKFIAVWDAYTSEMLQERHDSPTMTPQLWAANFAMDPLPDNGSMRFERSWVHEYDQLPSNLDVGITVDPAWTDKKKAGSQRSDRSAIVVSGVSPTGLLYVLDIAAGRWSPDNLVEKVFELCDLWQPTWGVGFEQDDKGLKVLFETEMQRTGRNILYRSLKPGTTDKERRAAPLHRLAQKWGLWVGRGHQALVDELLRFPVGKNDDYVDALAYRAFDVWFKVLRDVVAPKPMLTVVPGSTPRTAAEVIRRHIQRSKERHMKPWAQTVRQLA